MAGSPPTQHCLCSFLTTTADQDIAGRKYTALLFGLTNATSSLMGSASVYATGALLDAGYSWSAVFQLVVLAYVLGFFAFVTLASGERQYADDEG